MSLSGGVRLRRQLAQERAQHHDRLHALPLHLRRHRRPTDASDDVTVETCYYGRRHRRPAVQWTPLMTSR